MLQCGDRNNWWQRKTKLEEPPTPILKLLDKAKEETYIQFIRDPDIAPCMIPLEGLKVDRRVGLVT